MGAGERFDIFLDSDEDIPESQRKCSGVMNSSCTSINLIPTHFISFHFISFHFISFHFISFHIFMEGGPSVITDLQGALRLHYTYITSKRKIITNMKTKYNV